MPERLEGTRPGGMKLTSGSARANSSGCDTIRAAFQNAEKIHLDHDPANATDESDECYNLVQKTLENTGEVLPGSSSTGGPGQHCERGNEGGPDGIGGKSSKNSEKCPIVPLGHKNGSYFFISASGELRSIKAEALEAGRGVRALFSGVSEEAENWCRSNFATPNNDWSPKDAGHWIIKHCNAAGVFDPGSADATQTAIGAEARRLGADARQAATVSAILTGRDLALFDGKICKARLRDLEPYLREMLGDASEADVTSEGVEALDHLLSSVLPLDHGIRRSVQELLESVLTDTPIGGVDDPYAALKRSEVFLRPQERCLAIQVSKTSPIAKLYSDTKWRNGAHRSALLKLDGAVKPVNAVRLGPNKQQRVILIPYENLPFKTDEDS